MPSARINAIQAETDLTRGKGCGILLMTNGNPPDKWSGFTMVVIGKCGKVVELKTEVTRTNGLNKKD